VKTSTKIPKWRGEDVEELERIKSTTFLHEFWRDFIGYWKDLRWGGERDREEKESAAGEETEERDRGRGERREKGAAAAAGQTAQKPVQPVLLQRTQ
jgi:hypothetical protein